MLVRWEDDDLGTEMEIARLRKILEDRYNYEVRLYCIPAQRPDKALGKELEKWAAELELEDAGLVILYYGGHSTHSGLAPWVSDMIWVANPDPASPTLNWTMKQGIVHRADYDVLMLLDYYYAGKASYEKNCTGRKEGIWACNSEDLTTEVNDDSFTSNLIEELDKSCGSYLTVPMLHSSLNQRFEANQSPYLTKEPCYN